MLLVLVWGRFELNMTMQQGQWGRHLLVVPFTGLAAAAVGGPALTPGRWPPQRRFRTPVHGGSRSMGFSRGHASEGSSPNTENPHERGSGGAGDHASPGVNAGPIPQPRQVP